MRKLNLLLVSIIGLLILSCSSDDNETTEVQSQETKLFKKSLFIENGTITFRKEVNFDDNQNIESVVIQDYFFKKDSLKIERSNSEIISIISFTEYIDNNLPDIIENFTVTKANGLIKLISSNQDKTIELHYSNDNYVNLVKRTSINLNVNFEINLNRDSDNNIINRTDNGNNITNYSNFDQEKQIDPLLSDRIIGLFGSYLLIFDLKISKNNPLSISEKLDGMPVINSNTILNYDADGYVIKSRVDNHPETSFDEYEYIPKN